MTIVEWGKSEVHNHSVSSKFHAQLRSGAGSITYTFIVNVLFNVYKYF